MIKRLHLLFIPLVISFMFSSASAYFNVTGFNTTVVLSYNTSTARVIETFYIYMSNSSVNAYAQDRSAYKLTLSDWQNILKTSQLTPHILNPKASASNLTFLPGSLIPSGSGADALLLLSYTMANVTTVSETAPRKFEYTLNDSVFNFEHTVSGEALPTGTRLTIIIPRGSQVISIYPLPDSPPPNFVGNYSNVTAFSWFAAEPLSKFSFSYITQQSLQTEVADYFSSIYTQDRALIYIATFLLICVLIAFIYIKFIA